MTTTHVIRPQLINNLKFHLRAMISLANLALTTFASERI